MGVTTRSQEMADVEPRKEGDDGDGSKAKKLQKQAKGGTKGGNPSAAKTRREEEEWEGEAEKGTKTAAATQSKKPKTEKKGGSEEEESKEKRQQKKKEEAKPEGAAKGAGAIKAPDEIVEQGQIIFFYRPKVGVEEAGMMFQVQRFYFVMAPDGQGKRPRLAVIGKKKLPEIGSHQRFFGFIDAVAASVEELIKEALGERSYETKTRGVRHVAAARAAGEGRYSIINRGGSGAGRGRTNLVFTLQVPEEPGQVQQDFGIPKAGSYGFSVKNPANEPPKGAPIGLEEKADYTEEKKKEFGSYAWIGCTDPSLLEFERCEFLMVGVAADEGVVGELGVSAEELSGGEEEALACPDADEACLLEELKKVTQMETTGVSMAPVETGEWE